MTMNHDALKEADLHDRQRILTEITQNFFVQASAGSGKTTSLVGRMTAMVKAGIPVRQICAITFTKNAAAEFYHRFQKKLSLEAADTANPPEVRTRCQTALNEIDLAFMGTIDAFCSLILHEHPAEAEIPADAQVLEDDAAKLIYAREYARISNGEYSASLRQKADRFVQLVKKPKDAFIKGMTELTELRHTDIQYPKPSEQPFYTRNSAAIETLTADLCFLVQHPALALPVTRKGSDPDKYKKQLEAFSRTLDTLRTPEKWNSSPSEIEHALESLHGYRIVPDSTPVSLGMHDSDLMAEVMNNRKKVPEISHYEVNLKEHPVYQALRAETYGTVMDFFCDAARTVAEELRVRGELTFFDNLLYLRDMLRADAGQPHSGRLIRYITERHRYFLIDEFQDTNPLQAEIFFYLAAETPHPDWRRCKARPGSLFIVGDPKQSIYRYRNADVNSFLQVRALFESLGGNVLTLRQNFRSAPALCDWFNRFFSLKMPEQTADQSAYEPIPQKEAFSDKQCLTGVYTYRLNATDAAELLAEDTERVCTIIRKLAYHPEFTIQTADDSQPRMIRYSDFMVIARGKKKFMPYTEALAAYGIPSRVEGKLRFSDCPALVSLAGILNAAANPADTEAQYLAWSSPAAGLSQTDLLALQQKGIKRHHDAEADKLLSDRPDLLKFAQDLRYLAQLAKTVPFPRLADEAIRRMQLLQKAGTAHLEDLCYAQELIRKQTQDGLICNAKDGARFLMQMITEPAQERSLALDRNADCVHFANLHKVKGLEAPIVILAVPLREWKYTVSKRTEYSEQGAKSWFFEIAGINTDFFPTEEQAEKDAAAAENMRLLYVAATRAKCVLIAADRRTKTVDKATGEPARSKENFWAQITELPSGEIFGILPQEETPAQRPAQVRTAAGRLSLEDAAFRQKTYEELVPSKLKTAVRPISKKQDPNAPQPIRRRDANLIGSMIHRLMECIVSGKDRSERDTLCPEICREFSADPKRYLSMLKTVFDRMHSGGYPQEQGEADLLPVLLSADKVFCELPYSFYRDGKLWYGIMDTVYHTNGAWHIVDYKTNADGNDLDTVYAGQLSAYKDAFFELTGETADVRIYHIDTLF